MHRILLVTTPHGEEKVLAECSFKDNPAGAGKILEVKRPGKQDFEIYHFMMDRNEMVIYSSSDVMRGFRFLPGSWSTKWEFTRCDVTHGQDLLVAILEEIEKTIRTK